MDGHEFGKRLGLDWETELYMRLIEFVVNNKFLLKDEVAIQNMKMLKIYPNIYIRSVVIINNIKKMYCFSYSLIIKILMMIV